LRAHDVIGVGSAANQAFAASGRAVPAPAGRLPPKRDSGGQTPGKHRSLQNWASVSNSSQKRLRSMITSGGAFLGRPS
jgi:hypothetical protein